MWLGRWVGGQQLSFEILIALFAETQNFGCNLMSMSAAFGPMATFSSGRMG
jgi:hypothetical protein